MKMLAVCLLVCMGIAQIRAAGPAMSGPCAGWAQYNGYCYYYVPTAMSWANAEKNCVSMNAHLTSVHDINQYRFIQKLIKKASYGYPETWIGGSEDMTSTWSWTDGSPFDYTYWCSGEPSNNYYQRCLQMNYGGGKCWDNLQGGKKRHSVCSKPMG